MTTATILVAMVASAAAQSAAQSGTSNAPSVASPAGVTVEESVSFFLLEALKARSRLRDQGMESRADRFWGSASQFVQIVREAHPDDSSMFLPIIDGFRRTLADTVLAVEEADLEGVAGIQEALDDQISIHTSPGAFPDAKGLIQVEVRTLRKGAPVHNLYVSLDLFGSVPKGPSANELRQVTSPARGAVGPGRYIVRVRSPAGEVARRDLRIGKSGPVERIDVVLQ